MVAPVSGYFRRRDHGGVPAASLVLRDLRRLGRAAGGEQGAGQDAVLDRAQLGPPLGLALVDLCLTQQRHEVRAVGFPLVYPGPGDRREFGGAVGFGHLAEPGRLQQLLVRTVGRSPPRPGRHERPGATITSRRAACSSAWVRAHSTLVAGASAALTLTTRTPAPVQSVRACATCSGCARGSSLPVAASRKMGCTSRTQPGQIAGACEPRRAMWIP